MAKKKTSPKAAESQAGSEKPSNRRGQSPTRKKGDQSAGKKKKSTPKKQSTAKADGSKRRKECVVVGVGASAGGLEAYKRLLRTMSADAGMAFVLVQHLDPTHESLMVELLSKYTSMPVLQVKDAMPIQPNHVYMIPPNKFITIKDGGLFLVKPVTKRGVRLPIDYFFSSLAEDRKERSICIVLSGTGSDGADGIRHVKAEGGMTIVQKPETAEYDGMPRSAIATGAVDFILPVEDMVEIVVPYARHPYVQAKPNVTLADSAPDHFRAILSLLQAHTDQDFSHYKKGTLTRRIERRMGIRHINTPADYLKLLRAESDELRALFKDMLIGVTRFFRDSAAWNHLSDVMTRRILEKRNEEPVRVWVPGCSTGEEAYSIAIMLFEQQERQNKRLDIQVFATDIDSDAIDAARLGLYPESVTKDVSDAQIEAFFHREGEKLRVKKRLRESCIFAVQNLLTDAPYSNLDLISCRNLLIYLESDIQQKIFDMLHFALKPDGLLFLGSSESPAKRKKLFEPVSQQARIYRKLGEVPPGRAGLPVAETRRRGFVGRLPTADAESFGSVGTAELSKRALLEEFAPASVVVNHRGLIQYIHGPVRNYLDFPTGEPDLDLAAMALDGLKAKTRTALQQARSSNETLSLLAPSVRCGGEIVAVRIRVQPLPSAKGSEPLYLVSFFDESAPVEFSPSGKAGKRTEHASLDPADDDGLVSDRQLSLELQATREDLQSTIEELESANEELKGSNEEVMSMNEELQSTNEELETSREELQSLNEELSTVNHQLHDKVQELEATTNDLSNLLASTDMATLFLDSDLRIRRFTPATMRLMSLLDTDVGRPLSDLSPRVDDPDLVADAKEVLQKLTPVEKEVQNGGGHSYMRRITPFRTSDNKIEGVVVTFSDVTSLREASRRVEFRERQQAVIAQLGRAALAGSDLQSLFDKAVREVAETLDVDYAKVLELLPDKNRLRLVSGVGWKKGLVGKGTVPSGIDSQAGYTLQSAAPVIVRDLRKEKRFSGPDLLIEHKVVSGMSVIIGPEEAPWGVLGTHARREMNFTVDDTNFILAVANVLWEAIRRQTVEMDLRNNEARTAAFLRNSAVAGWMKNDAGRYVYWSETCARRFNLPVEDCLGKTDEEVWPPEVAERLRSNDRQVLEDDQLIEVVEEVVDPSGNPAQFMVSKFPFTDAAGNRYVGGLGVDITERVEAEKALAASQRRLQHLVDSASIGIAFAKNDGTVLQANDAMLEIFSISREEFEEQGWDWRNQVLPEDQNFADTMRRLGKDQSTEPVEINRKDADHDRVWVLASARPLEGEDSEYVAFLVDITAQKQAELALAESEERMRLAARVAGFGTYYGNVQTGELFWSPELKRILGLKPDDLVTVGIGEAPDFVHPEDRQRLAQKIAASLDPAGDGEFKNEHRIVRPDGEVRWLLMQGRTMFRGKGDQRHPIRFAGVALDITQRHQFEEELKEARDAAEAANEAKSRFLANMSHELRTPMTAILGFADVLQPRLKNADDQACLKTIKENGAFLCELLNDILDLSKIESGKLAVRLEACDVVALLASIRSLMSVRATEKGLTLAIQLESELPKTIETDSKMLRQILLNLVGNAVKFTEEGGVKISVRCLADQELLEVSVVDTGGGIEASRLESIFLPFEQLDDSATRTHGGTGLGLSITKKLVETLGGRITVESTPNEGSTFRFTIETGSLESAEWVLPDVHALAESESDIASAQLPTLSGRVLAIDDRREIRFLVREFVESAGGEIVTAEDAVQGLKIWMDHRDNGNSVNAVLMDMQMPGMDGLEATERLRGEGFEGPIIALTASAMRRDRDQCLQAGCNDFLSKPIDRTEFTQKLAHWMNPSAEDDLSKPQSPETATGTAVLCVDDHEDTGFAHKMLLELEGYQVTLATSASEALEAVAHFAPDAALVDLGLQDMSGAELLAEFKRRPELGDCLFVCLSGRQEDQVPWRELGFDHYLQKPADIEQIVRVLDRGKPD